MSTDRPVPGVTQVAEYLRASQSTIVSLLPPDVDFDRFTQTTIVAIQHTPDVLNADRQSFYNAIARAASDGLMPDGREGAFVCFNVRDNNEGVRRVVKWMPMVEGIIKQLGKAGITAYASSVYEKDEIEVWNDDNGQHVKHRPNPFKDRGPMIGAYAVAKVGERTFVETLNRDQAELIRKSSRSGDSGPWRMWEDRMWQKSALHRIKKRVPILDPKIAEALRDPEEDTDLGPALTVVETKQVVPAVVEDKPQPPPPPPGTRRPTGLQKVIERAKPQSSAGAIGTATDEGDIF
jgi:recombination protein RecT